MLGVKGTPMCVLFLPNRILCKPVVAAILSYFKLKERLNYDYAQALNDDQLLVMNTDTTCDSRAVLRLSNFEPYG